MERSKLVKWLMIIINIALVVVAILFYKSIISYIIIGFIFAYLIAPIINYAEKYRIPRYASILIVYLLIGFLLSLLISAIIPMIVDQFTDFQDSFLTQLQEQETINLESIGLGKVSELITKLEKRFPSFEIEDTFNSFINNENAKNLLNKIPSFFAGVFNVLGFMIVVPVIGFFLLKDGRIFMRMIFSKIGNRYFEFFLHLFQKIEESFGRFFRALLLETLLVALLSILGLVILNIPYALILGLIVGLANPIKYFGPFIGAVPTLLVILFGPTPDIFILYSIIMFFIVQQFDSLILFPWLMGKSMDLHPLIVLLTVIAGGYGFGLLGMLLAVPIVFLIKTIVEVSQKSLKEFEII
ncbi:MAG TPA: AI-2E family transporter [Candidatus Cloacimonetes bacterium]|nr:AI-2E family transporter [Candidatus Cloacimonadota bacterium]